MLQSTPNKMQMKATAAMITLQLPQRNHYDYVLVAAWMTISVTLHMTDISWIYAAFCLLDRLTFQILPGHQNSFQNKCAYQISRRIKPSHLPNFIMSRIGRVGQFLHTNSMKYSPSLGNIKAQTAKIYFRVETQSYEICMSPRSQGTYTSLTCNPPKSVSYL